MNIRRAQISELDQLAEWNRQLIEDEGHSNPMSLAELRKRMEAWIIGEYVAVIFSDTEDLGYALYREDKDEVYLRQFFVSRNRRREGLGKAAMQSLIRNCWPPTKRLTVDVLTRNDAGLSFWRSIGYRDYCLTLEFPKRANFL